MKIDILNFSEVQGKEIANAIMAKYNEYSYSFEKQKVEKEIYDRALHEATSFFLKHGDAKFDDNVIKDLKFFINTRVEHPSRIKKLTPEELLGNTIKFNIIDFLLENNIIIL